MFSMLGNPIIWYVIFGVALIAVIGILCGTYPVLRWIFATILVFVLVGSGVFSSVMLNKYYTAEGGMYGYIQTLISQNEAKKTAELSYDCGSVSFAPSVNKDEYTATFYVDEVLKIDNETTYGLFINGVPCSEINFGTDHISAKYNYSFYDYDDNVLYVDTLDFRISMFDNYTIIFVRTNGGSEAVKYWNSFVDKNGFTVEIKPFGYVNQ